MFAVIDITLTSYLLCILVHNI
jgi:hypothetical protein